MKDGPFLLVPREVGPTFYDTIIGACRDAGFEPAIGRLAPQLPSIVTLVAAEVGVSIGPPSMRPLEIGGAACSPIAGEAPTARLAPAHRRGDVSIVVRNVVARAMA